MVNISGFIRSGWCQNNRWLKLFVVIVDFTLMGVFAGSVMALPASAHAAISVYGPAIDLQEKIGDAVPQLSQQKLQLQAFYPQYLPVSHSALITGPLRVHPTNPRYFTDDSGKIIYLTGSHTWSNLVDSGDTDPPPVFDYTTYLDFLQANNHNFFRLWRSETAMGGEASRNYWFSPMPYQRTGPGNANDGKPRFDLTRFNQAYFDRLRARVIAARDRGIYVSVMLFDGWSVDSKFSSHQPWWGHPFNSNNNINGVNGDPNGNGSGEETHSLQTPTISPTITAYQEAYVRKVVDTVNDLDNVLYEISNESPGTATAWQYYMINYVKNYEATKPKQHPVGMTFEWPTPNFDDENAKLFASPADWISPSVSLYNPPAANGSKVILNDTDHLCGVCGSREWVWMSLTRGTHPVFMDPYNGVDKGRGSFPFTDPNDPTFVSIRKNLGYALNYVNRMNMVKMTPHEELASTSWCLANPTATGAEYLVYLPSGGTVTVNLSAAVGTLSVEWFNPATGAVITGSSITGGGSRNLTTPSGFSKDAVLYLYQPQTLSVTNVTAYPGAVTASIQWITNSPSTSQVSYGISPTLSLSTTEITNLVTSHQILLTDLITSTTYVYQVYSRDGKNTLITSGVFNFTTLASANTKQTYLPILFKS